MTALRWIVGAIVALLLVMIALAAAAIIWPRR